MQDAVQQAYVGDRFWTSTGREITDLPTLKNVDEVDRSAIKELRKNGIKCEIYPDVGESNKQQKRQWKYVTNRAIEFVVSKVENDIFTLKNMSNSEQSECSLDELIEKLK